MKKELSALEVYYLMKEIQVLIDSKVDNIYQPGRKEVGLIMHMPNIGKKILKITDKFIFLTERRSEGITDFCNYLRRKLADSRIRSIKQIDFERIIEIVFESKEGKYSLVAELFSNGNILLLKDNIILAATEYRKYSTRTIRPKAEYSHPAKEHNFLKASHKSVFEMFDKSNKDSVVKALAIDLGLGGLYAEECCLLADIDKNKKPKEADEKEIAKLFDAFGDVKNRKIEPCLVYENNLLIDAVPFDMLFYKDKKKEKAESFSAALEVIVGQITPKKLKYLSEIEKIRKIIKEQEENTIKLEQEAKEASRIGEMIYENYGVVSDVVRGNLDIKEIKNIDKKERAVLLEI